MGGDDSKPSLPDVLIPILSGNPALDPKAAPKKEAADKTREFVGDADRLVRSGGHDPDYISRMEEFAGLSHQEIRDRVQAMLPGVMHSAAQAWKKTGDAVLFNSMGLSGKVRKSVTQGWEGAAADAILAATQRFTDEMSDIHNVMQSVTMRIESAAYGAEVVKVQVPPVPPVLPIPIPRGAENPAQAVAQKSAEQEAHEAAIWAMRNYYVPAYEPAGQAVPIFTAPAGPNDGVGTPGAGLPGSTSSGNQAGASAGSRPDGALSQESAQENQAGQPSTTETENAVTPASLTEQPGGTPSTTPAGVDPSSTTPAAVTPSGTPGRPSTGVPGPGVPGTGWPGSGEPSGVPRPGAPGRSVPSPGVVPTPGMPGAPGVAGSPVAAGRPGTTGMMPPGARGKSDDEDEHKRRRELLVHERNKIDLLGERTPSVPPVLGANPDPPRDDWAEGRDRTRPGHGERA
ncbi:hypothetical protein [Nocardia abscessus]|uniref:hypothetical protein n=1 Tax=Nocardia abscessus TaxID=120957 RepID=UPI0024582716|nr:hypothetical protein [Nocardia abscessus]